MNQFDRDAMNYLDNQPITPITETPTVATPIKTNPSGGGGIGP